MRRIIPLMMAIALLMSMGFSSAATEVTEDNRFPVTASYVAGAEGGDVISVEIDWSGMNFTYNDASKPVWDATKHQYEPGTEAQWSQSNAYISFTNHSNVILQAVIEYSQNTGYESMSMNFTEAYPYIGSAETSDGAGEECEVTIWAVPMGTLKPDTPVDTNVGEIKISMTPVDDYDTILACIGDLCTETPTASDGVTVGRGYPYFASAELKQQVKDRYSEAEEALKGTSTPDKNLALNRLITAYYNNLTLMQE